MRLQLLLINYPLKQGLKRARGKAGALAHYASN